MASIALLQQQVNQLTAAVKELRQKVKALTVRLVVTEALRTKRMALSIGPVAVGTTDHVITWPVPFADDQYWIGVEILSGAAGFGTLHAQVKLTSRTAMGCEITVTATAAVAVVVLDVLAIRP